MRMRVSLYLEVPGRLAEVVKKSMLEDREINGKTEYEDKGKLRARLLCLCENVGTCFSTFEDRARCLILIEDVYGIIREKYELRKNQNNTSGR